MRPRDLARIGQLMIDGGAAAGQQVAPADWPAQCLTPRVSADEFRRFGYHWYMGDFAVGPPSHQRLEAWIGAFGNGGQRLWIVPELALIVVVTSGKLQRAGSLGAPDARVARSGTPEHRVEVQHRLALRWSA